MRLCRCQHGDQVEIALYDEPHIVSLSDLAAIMGIALPPSESVLDYLPPSGRAAGITRELAGRWAGLPAAERDRLSLAREKLRLLVPIADPKKIILLAGNYAEHIREGGGQAAQRQETFPYFFWKPPSTTLTHPGDPVLLPAQSPDYIDWEIELGVIIGKRCREVGEADALEYVAGYTICNDISDRQFRINPNRAGRPKDSFFDWLHGKWHDTFLPMGPCVRSAATVPDPQQFPLRLKVNGKIMQDGNTSQMIFPVAALVSILSNFVTLEAGDVISTGTPSGVGHGRKPPVYLRPGDVLEAEIPGIGVLRNPVTSPV
jgi:2-keto-4-pentenoate hydratase/2-oxohepta-3-ene-1,7-dioic acid hydratase in catechol pathway